MYFGTDNYWDKIAKLNNINFKKEQLIPENTVIAIPNY